MQMGFMICQGMSGSGLVNYMAGSLHSVNGLLLEEGAMSPIKNRVYYPLTETFKFLKKRDQCMDFG